jgi:predicted permease
LRRLLPRDRREFICGDLDEAFARFAVRRHGASAARRWYWLQVLASLAAVWRSGFFNRGSARPPQRGESRKVTRPEALVLDVRSAVSGLLRSPGYTATAVGTVALGVGAAAAVFGLVNVVLLRPVPGVREPEGLHAVALVSSPGTGHGMSLLNFLDVRERARSFTDLAAFQFVQLQVRIGSGEALELRGQFVAGDYFEALGVTAVAGRLFTAPETLPPAGDNIAVIGEELWERLFQRSPSAVGQVLHMNGIPVTIVGVAGGGFAGSDLADPREVWLPVSVYPAVRHMAADRLFRRGSNLFYQFFGRLRDGVTAAAAEQELNHVVAGLRASYPDETRGFEARTLRIYPGIGLHHLARAQARQTLSLLGGVVLLVLLVACANVTNLMLFRGVRRRAETAVRCALGASGGRILQLQMLESMMLAVLGAAGGLGVAAVITRTLQGIAVLRLPSMAHFVVDRRMLLFAVVAALIAVLAPTLLPAKAIRSWNLGSELRESVRQATGRSGRTRSAIVVVQLALSLTLVAGALALLRTTLNLNRVETGFDTSVLSAHIDPAPQGYTREQADLLQRRILGLLESASGVQFVAIASYPPVYIGFVPQLKRADDTAEAIEVGLNWVSPGFFETLGIDIVRGSALRAEDWTNGEAVVISQTLAKRLFGDRDPIGQRLLANSLTEQKWTVVGVAADTRSGNLRGPPDELVYQGIGASYERAATVFVKSTLPRNQVESLVRQTIRAADPSIPPGAVTTLGNRIQAQLSRERLLTRLFGAFAVFALILAGVGLYGVVAYMVAERTREIGVRIALGAAPQRIVQLVLGQTARFLGLGMAIGTFGAAGLMKLLESRLFGVSALDPATYVLSAVLFAAAGLAAALAPVRASLRVDPLTALRQT